MGMKRWLHAKVGTPTAGRYFRCSCDNCRISWSVWGDWPTIVSGALASLRRHAVDYHGGVDLSD